MLQLGLGQKGCQRAKQVTDPNHFISHTWRAHTSYDLYHHDRVAESDNAGYEGNERIFWLRVLRMGHIISLSASAGSCTKQVVEWVLGSVQSVWTDPHWQQHVALPAAFLKHYMPVQYSPEGSPEVPSLPALYEYLLLAHLASTHKSEDLSSGIHTVTGS